MERGQGRVLKTAAGVLFSVLANGADATQSGTRGALIPTPERLDLGWAHFYHGSGFNQIFRGALDWPFHAFVKKEAWWFGGYWQLSFSNWHTSWADAPYSHSEQILALSPVFRLQYNRFFWDFGIGASVVSHTRFSDRRITSHGHFEDRMGVGFTFGPQSQYQIGYTWIHYSNAGIAKPNNGLDMQLIHFGIVF